MTREWQPRADAISGVVIKEVHHVLKDNGYLTEMWRADWTLSGAPVAQATISARVNPCTALAFHRGKPHVARYAAAPVQSLNPPLCLNSSYKPKR